MLAMSAWAKFTILDAIPRAAGPKSHGPGCQGAWRGILASGISLVEAIARAATDNHRPRVDVKSGNVEQGVNGGFQGTVKSPMNKGRVYRIPGIGLAGD
jgi:hypothetical protein